MPVGQDRKAHAAQQESPTCTVVERESELADLRLSWDELVHAMPRPSPFLLNTWLVEWYRHYGRGADLFVQAAFRDETLVAALPLVRTSWRGFRVGRFLGGQQSSLADLLLDPSEPEATGAALVARASSGHDFAELFGLAADSRVAQIAGPGELHLFRRADGPVLELTDDWDALYETKVSAKRRSSARRRLRQLQERGKVEFSVARSRTEVEGLLADAFRLHTLRWRGRPDGSGFATPTGVSFHRAALTALADQDVVRLATMSIDGRAIAFTLAFALAGRLYGYRMAFDPSFAPYSPGVLTLYELLAAASREGLRRVELLGAADQFKLELADGLEPIYVGLGLPGSARGRAVVTARMSVRRLRERLRSSPAARHAYDTARPLIERVAHTKDVLKA